MHSAQAVTPTTPQQLVADVLHLITLPDIWFQLQDILQDPEHRQQQVVDLITYDHALTAKLLRMVNSAYFGLPQKVERLSQAINIVGEQELNALVLTSTIAQAMDSMTAAFPNLDDYWLHNVRTAVLARQVAKGCNVLHPERLFVAGLLHDIGKLVIYQQLPDIGTALYAEPIADTTDQQRERRALGFDHAEVGAALVESWELPASFRTVIAHHHAPRAAQDYVLETLIVAVSNLLVDLVDDEQKPVSDAEDILQLVSSEDLMACKLDPESVSELMLETIVEAMVVRETFFGAADRAIKKRPR